MHPFSSRIRHSPTVSRLLPSRVFGWLGAIFVTAGLLLSSGSAVAQTLTLSADVGSVPAAGSSTFVSGSALYQLSGTGVGLADSADAFHFAYSQVLCGDGQIVVRLGSADATALSALVLRESLDADARCAAVAVSGTNARFVRRLSTNGAYVSGDNGNGALAALAPCWLKLVRSGDTLSGYVSADGQSWSVLGSDTLPLSGTTCYIGLAVSNGSTDAATGAAAASFDNVQSSFLPAVGLRLWLRADAGVTADPSTGAVSAWTDQAGGCVAGQSNTANQPTLVANEANGRPAIRFDGNGRVLNLPDLMSSAGAGELFVIVRATAPTERHSFMNFGANSYRLAIYPYSDGHIYDSFGSTDYHDEGIPAANLRNFHLYDVLSQPGEWAARLNGLLQYTTASNTVGFTATPTIGWSDGYANTYFEGDFAEIALFDHALTDDERHVWEAYLNAKYQFNPPPAAPTQVSVSALSPTQTSVAWTETAATVTGYTVERQNADGSWLIIATPGAGSTSYIDSGLLPGTSYTYRITAANTQGQSPASSAVSGTTDVGGTAPATFPTTGLRLWLRADSGVTTDANGAASGWIDQAGSALVTQATAGNRPALVANDVNGLPALRFDGGSSHFDSNFIGMGGQELTFFAVAKGTQYQSIVRFQAAGGSDYLDYPWTAPCTFVNSADGGVNAGVPSGFIQGEWNIGAATYKAGATVATYRNGTLVSSRAAGPAALPGGMPFCIGWYPGGSEYLQADVAEILIYNRALRDTERAAVEAYLNAKYAVVAAPGAPAAPSGSAISSSQANLFWQPPATGGIPQGFSLERKTVGVGDFTEVAAIAGGQVGAFIDEQLSPSASYTYRLRAYNAVGYSGYSAETTVTLPSANAAPASLPDIDSLTLWLKPNAGVTKDANGLVSAWSDASGHGNDAVAALPANEPQWLDGVLNGWPVLRFDGVANSLRVPVPVVSTPGNATILAVVRLPDASTRGPFVEVGYGGGFGVGVGGGTLDDNGNNLIGIYDYVRWIGTGHPLGVGAALAEMTVDGAGTAAFYRNGISQGVFPGGGPTTPPQATLIGGSSFYSRYFRGDIAEALVFDHVLSDADRQIWESYLNAKYHYDPPPLTPGALTVSSISASQVAISWTDNSPSATGYTLERQNADGSWSVVATLGAGATTYIDGNLAAGTSYAYRVTATNAAGASPTSAAASGATEPSGNGNAVFPAAGLQVWLRADTGVTAANGLVSRWGDQLGNGNDATQTDASRQPQQVPGIINGLPILRFNGSNDQLKLPSSVAADNFTFYAVARPTAAQKIDPESTGGYPGTSGETYLFGAYPGAPLGVWSQGSGAGLSLGTNGASVYEHSYGYLPALAVFPTDLSGGFSMVGVEYQNRQPSIYLNGILSRTGLTSPQPQVHAPLEIGSGSYGAFAGDLAEVLIYDHALSESERMAVEAYLNARYAIVAAPGVPTGVSAAAMSTTQANLLWTASVAAGRYSVERKDAAAADSDFVEVAALPGKDVQAYIDASLTPGASYSYRVRAWNPTGYSAYSNVTSVTLPVAGTAPLPATDALLLWLKPDVGVTHDGNGLVSTWTDASGHGNNALQGRAASQPQWVDNVLNGQPVLRFDGNTDALATNLPVITTSNNATILAVVRLPDASTHGPFIKNGLYAGFAFGVGSGTLDASGNDALGLYDYSRWLNSGAKWGVGAVLAEMTLDSTGNPAMYRNGTLLGNLGAGAPIASTGPTFIGGYSYDTGRFLRGDIAEVVMFNRVLTDTERQAWELYLNAKYNYDPAPPAPAQVATAVLSPTQISLGWVENFANISGYRIEQRNGTGAWSVIATLPGNATSYVASGLVAGAQYAFRVTAINHTGESPTVATSTVTTPSFGPPLPVASLRLWLRADSGPVTDGNGGVTQWLDTSGLGNTARQTNASALPHLAAGAVAGMPAVHFDGTSSSLNLPDVMAGAAAGEMFVVVRAASGKPVSNSGFVGFGNCWGTQAYYPDSSGGITDGFGSTALYSTGAPAVDLTQFHLYDASSQPGEWTNRIDGALQFTTSGNTVGFTSTPTIGFSYGHFAGDIAEILVFDHALSAVDRQAVQSYVAAKYGLAPIPPAPVLSAYALSPGQVSLNWVCPAGSTATHFEVEREIAGSGSYQMIGTVNGATNFIDATAAPGTAYSYRVEALNFVGGSSAPSNEAPALTPAAGTDMPVSGLRLWLKPAAGSPGPLSRWVDQSGNGNDAVQSVAASQPQIVNNPFAFGAVRNLAHFNGSNFLQLPTILLSGVNAAEAFVVVRAADPLVSPVTRGLWTLNGRTGAYTGAFYPAGDGNLYESFGTGTRYGPMTSPAPLDQFNLYDVAAASNAWTARLNGQVLSTNQTNTVDFSPGNLFLGQSSEGAPLTGDVAEVLVFDHTLSDAERQAVQRYFTAQYALAGFLVGQPDADADGDGISNYQEYLNGTDPLDYYNGQTPLISIAGGNLQPGAAGAFSAQPLSVLVTSASGTPLGNAPVVFTIARSTGLLADPAAPANLASTITVRTAADGTASVLFQAPQDTLVTTSLVTATAGTASRVSQVTFVEAAVATDDTSGDGLPDGWKLQHGLNLLTNDAAGDPDGDGLTNLQEYYLGTDPNTPDVTADGVPFGWLAAHGLNPLYDSDTALDPNGAGLSYAQEYQLEQSTIDLWKFDEGSQSTTTTSSSGYKDAGVLVNNPAWIPDPDGGTALAFNQTGAQVDFALATDAHLDFAAQQSFSVTARFQTTATGVARLAGKGVEADSVAAGYFLGIENGQLTAGIGSADAQSPSLRVLTTTAYNDGQWHHVAAVFDRTAGQARLYVDGLLQTVAVDTGSAGVSQGTSVDFSAAAGLNATRPDMALLIGALDLEGTESFAGTLDNVGLFSKALAAAEVKALAGSQNNALPVVAIDSPLPATEFPGGGSIAIDAQASSPSSSIGKVEFFSGAVKLGEADAFPYVITWAQVPVGTYTITAKATDNRGASATSAPVTITVSADSDQDGLPDDWEMKYFGNLDQSAAGSFLNDGISNLTKYQLGLDPTKSITSDTNNSTGLVVFTPLR